MIQNLFFKLRKEVLICIYKELLNNATCVYNKRLKCNLFLMEMKVSLPLHNSSSLLVIISINRGIRGIFFFNVSVSLNSVFSIQ